MKQTLYANKFVRHVGLVLLFIMLTFTSLGASSPIHHEQKSTTQVAISNYQEAQHNVNLSDEEKIKAAIDAYFITRYEGQKALEQQDFSPILDDDTLDWVKKEKDKREVELYVASVFDLGYESYSYTLDYTSIEVKNKKATVQVFESHEVVFKAISPEISKMANLQHTITLHYKKDGWVIYKDEYQDELSQQLVHLSKEDIKKQVDENYQEDVKRKENSRIFGGKFWHLPQSNHLDLLLLHMIGLRHGNMQITIGIIAPLPLIIELIQAVMTVQILLPKPLTLV